VHPNEINPTDGLLRDADIVSVVADIGTALLGLELAPGPVAGQNIGKMLTGCVQITGAWAGAVSVDCSATLARRVAEGMFGAEPGAVSDEEVHDAIGELANMVGGNLKALLPGPSALSLPSITQGSDYRTNVQGTALTNEVAFHCDVDWMRVTVAVRGASDLSGSR
jgi:chemotaxis protein CheX